MEGAHARARRGAETETFRRGGRNEHAKVAIEIRDETPGVRMRYATLTTALPGNMRSLERTSTLFSPKRCLRRGLQELDDERLPVVLLRRPRAPRARDLA